jgi:tetratricopeptide (TPR) repeat protein
LSARIIIDLEKMKKRTEGYMQKILLILTIIIIFSTQTFADEKQAKDLIEEGITLHNKGDFNEAIKVYKKALTFGGSPELINYEIAYSYFAMKEYKKAIQYTDKLLIFKSKYNERAYVVKGSSYDLMGNAKEAVSVFKIGIKEYPKSNLLYYNLAYVYFKLKENKKAENAVIEAIKLKPSHSSSHILLGYCMLNQNKKIKSLLALYHFLLLETNTSRSLAALNLINNIFQQTITKENKEKLAITIDPNDITDSKENDYIDKTQFAFVLILATNSLEENKNKSKSELFVENNESLFKIFVELKNNKKLFWSYYIDMFSALSKSGHTEAFSYYIQYSLKQSDVNNWLFKNKNKVDSLIKWIKDYKIN